jgi:hypothetical protein
MPYTIQEIFNAVHDTDNNVLNTEETTSPAETDGTVQDILNKVFNPATNKLRVS